MVQEFVLYAAPCRGNARNTLYPNAVPVRSADDLARAVAFDHTAAEFSGGRRSRAGFIQSNCIALDLDNDFSDDPAEWKELADIEAAFPRVSFYAVESRNHLRAKGNKAPRPKYHLYFPISVESSTESYEDLKHQALGVFPWFDGNALDAARFFFGVERPAVHYRPGDMTLGAYLLCFAPPPVVAKATQPESQAAGESAVALPMPSERRPVIEIGQDVEEGRRNAELHRFAFRKWMQGLSAEEVLLLSQAANERFSCPLPQEELQTLVLSACSKPLDRDANLRRAEIALEFAEATQGAGGTGKAAPGAAVQCLADLEERTPEWLIPGLIPRGEITLLAGDGGVGKTFAWCSIAAGVSSGQVPGVFRNPFGLEAGGIESERVLFLSSEDDAAAVLLPRLRASGADLSQVFTIDCRDPFFAQLKFGTSAFEKLIEKYRPSLMITDPLQSFLARGVDMSSRNQMRQSLEGLHRLGAEYGTSFLIILHSNKSKGTWGRQRMADSSDIWDISRSVLMCGSADQKGALRYLSQEKNSYAPLSQTTLFTIDGNTAAFTGNTDRRDRDFVLAASKAESQTPERDSAARFILEELQAHGGRVTIRELNAAAAGNLISAHTLRRAKDSLRQAGKIEVGKDSEWFLSLLSI